MLKGIPSILSPELLKILMEMGHGDELVIGDGNFPAASNAQRLIRCDGHGVPELLDAILTLMPLDTYVDAPVALMETTQGDPRPVIWDEYREIVMKHQKNIKPNLSSASPSMSGPKRPMQSSPPAKRPCMPTSSSKKAL